jgi:hypothetical protein
MTSVPDIPIDSRPPCTRCGKREFKLEWWGLHTGEVGGYCCLCGGYLEHMGRGRRLPDHPLFREAPTVLKEAEHLIREYRKPIGPNRSFPTAVAQLQWAVAKVKPPEERAKRRRRVLD